jgi:hypothetical protein
MEWRLAGYRGGLGNLKGIKAFAVLLDAHHQVIAGQAHDDYAAALAGV